MSCVPDNFYEQVYNIVSQVPSGTVITYKSIAVLMGYPQHARLVGRALKLVPKNLNIPCHRVVNCQGSWRIRTAVNGFADRCLTTRPRNPYSFE